LDEAVETLRSRIQRSNGAAFVSFTATLFWIWLAYDHGVFTRIDGHDVLSKGAINLLIAGLFVAAGLEQIRAKSQDKLLLLLAEEALARFDESRSEQVASPSS
jgi:hypothetical protein